MFGGEDSVERAREFAMQTGLRLQRLRLKRGWSQAGLARSVGVGRSTLAMWESGRRSIHLEQLYRLSLSLGVSPAELLEDATDSESN